MNEGYEIEFSLQADKFLSKIDKSLSLKNQFEIFVSPGGIEPPSQPPQGCALPLSYGDQRKNPNF
jgi:hypothetical protein